MPATSVTSAGFRWRLGEPPGPAHCAGGRDRTGMIGSMLLMLAGATDEAVVANYEAGFRGAAQHRGHGLAFDVDTGQWVAQAEEAYVLGSGVEPATLTRLQLLV